MKELINPFMDCTIKEQNHKKTIFWVRWSWTLPNTKMDTVKKQQNKHLRRCPSCHKGYSTCTLCTANGIVWPIWSYWPWTEGKLDVLQCLRKKKIRSNMLFRTLCAHMLHFFIYRNDRNRRKTLALPVGPTFYSRSHRQGRNRSRRKVEHELSFPFRGQLEQPPDQGRCNC